MNIYICIIMTISLFVAILMCEHGLKCSLCNINTCRPLRLSTILFMAIVYLLESYTYTS